MCWNNAKGGLDVGAKILRYDYNTISGDCWMILFHVRFKYLNRTGDLINI